MKKIMVALLLASSIFVHAETQKTASSDDETKFSDKVESAGTEIMKGMSVAGEKIGEGAEKAGNGIKNFFSKTKEKNSDGKKENVKEKASEIGKKVGDGIKSGAEKTKEAINTHQTKILTGTLKVKGSGKNMKMTFKADDGKSYSLRTISGSEDSMLKLSAYNKKKIKISGVFNTETNELTLTTYKLAKED